MTLPQETSWEGCGSSYLCRGASLGPLGLGSRERERATWQGTGDQMRRQGSVHADGNSVVTTCLARSVMMLFLVGSQAVTGS